MMEWLSDYTRRKNASCPTRFCLVPEEKLKHMVCYRAGDETVALDLRKERGRGEDI